MTTTIFVTIDDPQGTQVYRFRCDDEQTKQIGYKMLCLALGLTP